ncbi:MAG: shikimate kinase [Actinomycetota bacterium]|nr:shikimate kinase [Actinomycetota bacterium]
MTGPRLVLVGPPGAGKTTVGALVAERLGVPFRDTDDDIATAAGKDIPHIFFDEGEPAFRALESEAVSRALEEHVGVLAVGGGAVLSAGTCEQLLHRPVVFLDVSLPAATQRVGLGRGRPVLALNPRAMLQTLLAERRPLYEQVATYTVHTDGHTPDQVADAVVAVIG